MYDWNVLTVSFRCCHDIKSLIYFVTLLRETWIESKLKVLKLVGTVGHFLWVCYLITCFLRSRLLPWNPTRLNRSPSTSPSRCWKSPKSSRRPTSFTPTSNQKISCSKDRKSSIKQRVLGKKENLPYRVCFLILLLQDVKCCSLGINK